VSIAGIEPGIILVTMDGRDMTPPEHLVFAMGKEITVEIVDRDNQRRSVSIDVERPSGKKLHFVDAHS